MKVTPGQVRASGCQKNAGGTGFHLSEWMARAMPATRVATNLLDTCLHPSCKHLSCHILNGWTCHHYPQSQAHLNLLLLFPILAEGSTIHPGAKSKNAGITGSGSHLTRKRSLTAYSLEQPSKPSSQSFFFFSSEWSWDSPSLHYGHEISFQG